MKIPAPMMPPTTAMVVPKRPRCRASPPLREERSLRFSGRVTMLRSTGLRQFVEVFDVRKGRAVHAPDFGIFRFDDVIFVGRVRAVAMSQAKVRSRQTKRIAGENVAGPGAGQARKHHGINSVFLVNAGGRANNRGIGGR